MAMAKLAVLCAAVALLASVCSAVQTWNSGAGTVYKISVIQDVFIENQSNKNYYGFTIVGKHPQYNKKRALYQFEQLPATCTNIAWAKMYLYFIYAHKASWQTVQSAPYSPQGIQVHQLMQEWRESEATQFLRLVGVNWNTPYVGLDNIDASPIPTTTGAVFTSRPAGFMEFDITSAIKNWQQGQANYGVMIWSLSENSDRRDLRFASKENADSQKRPFVNVLCT